MMILWKFGCLSITKLRSGVTWRKKYIHFVKSIKLMFQTITTQYEPIHTGILLLKNKIWSSTDWPFVRERRAPEAGHQNLWCLSGPVESLYHWYRPSTRGSMIDTSVNQFCKIWPSVDLRDRSLSQCSLHWLVLTLVELKFVSKST